MALSENATIENTLDKSVYTEDVKVGENAFTFAVGGNTAVITITITDSANDFKWTNTTKILVGRCWTAKATTFPIRLLLLAVHLSKLQMGTSRGFHYHSVCRCDVI